VTSSDVPRAQPGPEDEGIPDHADDMSTAFDEADRPRFADSPPTLPADEPQAVDEHGVTAAEQREGESLEARLAREEPDRPPEYDRVETGGQSAEEAAVQERSEQELARDDRPDRL
jgi:hypothetical protein